LTTGTQNALKAIETKDYAVPWKSATQEPIKIGIGLTSKGKCVVLFGDESSVWPKISPDSKSLLKLNCPKLIFG
jgi:hypothetical protein